MNQLFESICAHPIKKYLGEWNHKQEIDFIESKRNKVYKECPLIKYLELSLYEKRTNVKGWRCAVVNCNNTCFCAVFRNAFIACGRERRIPLRAVYIVWSCVWCGISFACRCDFQCNTSHKITCCTIRSGFFVIDIASCNNGRTSWKLIQDKGVLDLVENLFVENTSCYIKL